MDRVYGGTRVENLKLDNARLSGEVDAMRRQIADFQEAANP